ncbi:hypothetical protein CPB83DRAFT_855037 [Crepidotus variabilis]|uniref:Uncharacterized protein n=1 Tax=Crepidotus variabilis TaxID=179855 RepID=A0A9P6EFY0_9AGAR|nr:hypothetical protein CPB83DRAFT_855037 [Crepidotus variabilis]
MLSIYYCTIEAGRFGIRQSVRDSCSNSHCCYSWEREDSRWDSYNESFEWEEIDRKLPLEETQGKTWEDSPLPWPWPIGLDMIRLDVGRET